MIVALLALFVALGGPAQAAKLINGAKIKPDSVASKQIKDRSLKTRDLERRAVRSLKETPEGSIGSRPLAQNSVTTQALAPGSVLTGHIADNALTAADLGTNSVGTEEIADNAVGQAQIRTNGVGAAEIADASIGGGEIVDGGLSIRDVARQVGTMEWPVPDLEIGGCFTASVPVTGIEIAGDFVLITPTSAWPADLVYSVDRTVSETSFRVTACNRAAKRVTGATYAFNYAILGF